MVPKRTKFLLAPSGLLIPLPSDAACQLDIFWHDGDPFCVDRTKVSILEEAYQVCLRGLLQCYDGPTLKVNTHLAEVLGNLSHQSLKWQLPDEQLG